MIRNSNLIFIVEIKYSFFLEYLKSTCIVIYYYLCEK